MGGILPTHYAPINEMNATELATYTGLAKDMCEDFFTKYTTGQLEYVWELFGVLKEVFHHVPSFAEEHLFFSEVAGCARDAYFYKSMSLDGIYRTAAENLHNIFESLV